MDAEEFAETRRPVDFRLILGVALLLAAAWLVNYGVDVYPGKYFENIHNNARSVYARRMLGEPPFMKRETFERRAVGFIAAGGLAGIAGFGFVVFGAMEHVDRRRTRRSWPDGKDAERDRRRRRLRNANWNVRWLVYLILALLGAEVGVALVGLIVAVVGYVTVGPVFFLIGTIPLAVGIAGFVLAVPVYAVLSALAGLVLSKWRVKAALNAQLKTADTSLYGRVASLAYDAGLDRPPEVGVYDSATPNALATGRGRNSGLVLFSSALLENFADNEVEAVAAHEVGHLANGDMLALNLVRGVQNGMSWMMAFYGLRRLVQCTVFFVTELASRHLSRRREYRADALAADLVGADNMIAALRRLDGDDGRLEGRERRYAFTVIHRAALSTHPPIARRIAALEQHARKQDGERDNAPKDTPAMG